MEKIDLIEQLLDTGEYELIQLEAMTPYQLLDAWLTWEGIIGYTGQILDVFQAAYSITLD